MGEEGAREGPRILEFRFDTIYSIKTRLFFEVLNYILQLSKVTWSLNTKKFCKRTTLNILITVNDFICRLIFIALIF